MIRSEILERLLPITQEEAEILEGAREIDRSIYTSHGGSVVRLDKLVPEKKQISVRKHTRFIRFPEHTHDYVEAVYMCSGSTTHIINHRELMLREGELLFLGQNASQEILPAGEGDIAVNFLIRPEFFNKTLEMLGAEETPIKNFLIDSLLDKDNRGYLYFKVSDVPPVQNLVENLIWTLLYDVPNKRNINQITMGLLFMQLLNHTDTLVCETREDRAIMEIFRYIEANYRDGSLEDAAKILHYDYYWLSHEIKNRTGRSYVEHVQERRLAQAAFLLRNTKMSVEEIALAVGYENKSYFHKLFSKHFALSPAEYRRKN